MRKLNAFEKWLLMSDPMDAVHHVIECLKSDDGEAAWDFMSMINGPSWSCPPNELPNYILKSIRNLRKISELGGENEGV